MNTEIVIQARDCVSSSVVNRRTERRARPCMENLIEHKVTQNRIKTSGCVSHVLREAKYAGRKGPNTREEKGQIRGKKRAKSAGRKRPNPREEKGQNAGI
jgi:hypothetical protein